MAQSLPRPFSELEPVQQVGEPQSGQVTTLPSAVLDWSSGQCWPFGTWSSEIQTLRVAGRQNLLLNVSFTAESFNCPLQLVEGPLGSGHDPVIKEPGGRACGSASLGGALGSGTVSVWWAGQPGRGFWCLTLQRNVYVSKKEEIWASVCSLPVQCVSHSSLKCLLNERMTPTGWTLYYLGPGSDA